MAYELIETDREIQITGTCFIDELVTPKCITVDGDLIADRLRAPSILVTHGSLLCPRIEAEHVHADILGIYVLDRLYDGPATYIWLRPTKTQPDPRRWSSEDSIANVLDMLSWPELVRLDQVPEFTTTVIAKATARPVCGRTRVLVYAALESLRDAKALTPLGHQVVQRFLAGSDDRLPTDWRW